MTHTPTGAPERLALDALADLAPKHVASLALSRDEPLGCSGLLLLCALDGRGLAHDPHATLDLLAFLDTASDRIHRAAGIAPGRVRVAFTPGSEARSKTRLVSP